MRMGASGEGSQGGVCWSSVDSGLERLGVLAPTVRVASVGQGGGTGPPSCNVHLLPTPSPSW